MMGRVIAATILQRIFRGYICALSDRAFKFSRSRAEIRCILADIVTRKENGAGNRRRYNPRQIGFGFYKSKIAVDVTGDADLLYKMGVPTLKRGNYDSYFGRVINMDSIKSTRIRQYRQYLPRRLRRTFKSMQARTSDRYAAVRRHRRR